jgi:4'-phosphopantetheinyl transferase
VPVLLSFPPGSVRDTRLEPLDPVELERASALAPGPRGVFVAGRRALRQFAAGLLDVPASDLRTNYSCPRCGTGPGLAHGRPGYTLRGKPVPLALSLSRSSGWILLGAVLDPPLRMDIGVDVEAPARMGFAGFDAVALTPVEQASLAGLAGMELWKERARLWVRKEAWLKMTGDGLATAPDTVDVLSNPGIRVLAPGEAGLPPELCAAVALSPAPETGPWPR